MKFFIAFIFLFLAEISVISAAIESLGFTVTFAFLILAGITGAALIRKQGAEKMLLASQALQRGQKPTDELFEGFFYVLAGILFIIPGFISDCVALLLLWPSARRWLQRHICSGKMRDNANIIIEGEYEMIDTEAIDTGAKDD